MGRFCCNAPPPQSCSETQETACIQHTEPLFYEHDGEQVSFPGNSALFNVKSLRNTLICPMSHSPKIEAQQAFFDLLPVHRDLRGVVDVCPIPGRRFPCGASSGHGAGEEGGIRSKATPTRNRRTRTAFPGNSSARPYPARRRGNGIWREEWNPLGSNRRWRRCRRGNA